MPSDVDSPKFKASIGKVTYAPEKDAIIWQIRQFQGRKEYLMRAHFGLPSINDGTHHATPHQPLSCLILALMPYAIIAETAEERPPVTVKFEIPYFTVSGIQVRYLKIIERSGYQALPWVRYITQSGDYQIRI